MLADFFKLDGEIEEFDEIKLAKHFQNGDHLKNVLYRPNAWPDKMQELRLKQFQNVSLAKTKFSNLTFKECKFEDCLFIASDFISVEFHRCKFINCNFYKSEMTNVYIDPTCFAFDKSYLSTHANVGVDLFHTLLENSASSRQSEFEMKSDMLFRKWKRAQLKFDLKKDKISKFEYYSNKSKSYIYEKIAGFGYKPGRFAFWTVAVFLFVSLFNHLVLAESLSVDGVKLVQPSYADSIFYSFSMLTALGFSSIIPLTDFAKILAVLEALAGIGWLGIFTSILVRRFIK